jgi:hypothetical protein
VEIIIIILLGITVGMFILPLERKLLWRFFHWIDRKRGDAMPRDWYDY